MQSARTPRPSRGYADAAAPRHHPDVCVRAARARRGGPWLLLNVHRSCITRTSYARSPDPATSTLIYASASARSLSERLG